MTIKGEFFGKIVTYLFSSIFLVSSKSKLCFRTPCSGSSLSRRFSSAAAAAALYYQHYGGFVQLPFPPTTKNSWLCAYIKWLLLLPSSNNIVVECKNTLSHATQSCEAFSFQMPALRAKMPDVNLLHFLVQNFIPKLIFFQNNDLVNSKSFSIFNKLAILHCILVFLIILPFIFTFHMYLHYFILKVLTIYPLLSLNLMVLHTALCHKVL